MKYDKEKTLFVTDMDGTLLDPTAQLSSYTAEVLREVVFRGYNLTVATGRNPESPKRIFEQHGIPLNLPVIGRNGVLIYDAKLEKYLQIHKIPCGSAQRVLELMDEHETQVLLLDTLDCNKPKSARRGTVGFSERPDDMENVLFIAADGDYQRLASIYESSLKLPGVGGIFGCDGYIPDDWCVELFSENASKGEGIRFVMKRCGFSRSVCFGDNVNDYSMFEVCDEAYAPENAVHEVKAAADAVIGANAEDGVARWLERNLLD